MTITPKQTYNDNFIDKLFIWLFSRKIAKALGKKYRFNGYQGFVDLSKQIAQGRNPKQQQELVTTVLYSIVPEVVLSLIRRFFNPSQWVCEWNAWFATILFEWLVGPCEQKEVEVMGENHQARIQKSCVHIKKCRYLEASGCVGLCLNVCKVPTQSFFTQGFGIPVTMTPNFEDFSCDMVFGKPPQPLENEPEYHEPCLTQFCSTANPKADFCPKIRD